MAESGAHEHPEFTTIGSLALMDEAHSEQLSDHERRLRALEQAAPPPPPPPDDEDPGDRPDWAVGYARDIERPVESYELRDGDVDSLIAASRAGGVHLNLPQGGTFQGSRDRFEQLWVGSNTWIDCPTLDARIVDMPIHTEEGEHVTGNVLLRGFSILHPNLRQWHADGLQIAHSPVDNVVIANVTIHEVADEQAVVWGKVEKGGSPRRITFYRVLHTGPVPLHPASDQRGSHGLLIGYQKSWDAQGNGFFGGDMRDTQITAWECVYLTSSRQPVVGSLATYHSVRCIRRHWTGYSAASRYSGRLKSSGDVWDARTPNGKERETAVIHQDRFGGRGPEDAVVDVEWPRYLNGAGSDQPNTGTVEVPYPYPQGAMSDDEIASVLLSVGSR